jgi:hypothetical protein
MRWVKHGGQKRGRLRCAGALIGFAGTTPPNPPFTRGGKNSPPVPRWRNEDAVEAKVLQGQLFISLAMSFQKWKMIQSLAAEPTPDLVLKRLP